MVAHGWELDVERGPDWLFVRPQGLPEDGDQTVLAEQIWSLLERNFSRRLVLELDRVDAIRSALIGQLVWLHKRIHAGGGMMRLTGLSQTGYDALRICRLDDRFPKFSSREEAVLGWRPTQPR
jgi:anti-anti-sigma factor